MVNTHQGQQETKDKQNKGYDKEEKRVPKLIIRLGGKPTVIGSSDEENSNNLKLDGKKTEHVVSFIASIADKVKLRKRGQSSTSDAQLFKSISQSSLPEKKRQKKSISAFVSSQPVLPSSTLSPFSIETDKAMFQSDSNKTPIPILTFEPRTAEVITVRSRDYVQFPSLNSETYLSFDDTSISNPGVSSYNLPSKKAKLLEQYPFVNEKSPPTSSTLVDIHQLEVASYEEVSSVEHFHTSSSLLVPHQLEVASYEEVSSVDHRHTSSSVSVPPEYFGITDIDAEIPSTSMLQKINSISLPENIENPVLTTIKTNHTLSENCKKNQKNNSVSLDHDYLITMEEIDMYEKELTTLESSVIEEFFSRAKELSLVKERTSAYVDKIVDLAIEIEKQPNCQEISSKVNSLVKKDSNADILPAWKHSIQAGDGQNINGLKNRIISREGVKVTKSLSRSSTGYALSSKIHTGDNKNIHENNSLFRQENPATKDKRKAMDGRCIVYVGNIPHDYSVSRLRERFKKFGAIKDIQIKSKVRCDFNSSDAHSLGSEDMRNYGFITFSCNQEASDAIEGGNNGHKLQFYLSFGARRQFVGEEYKDLDGIVAKNEISIYKDNSRLSFLPQNKEEDDFDIILKNAMKARGVKPQPFRMKCKV